MNTMKKEILAIEYELHHRMTVQGKKGYWAIKQDCCPKDEDDSGKMECAVADIPIFRPLIFKKLAEAMNSMNALKSAFPEVEFRVCKITREIIGV